MVPFSQNDLPGPEYLFITLCRHNSRRFPGVFFVNSDLPCNLLSKFLTSGNSFTGKTMGRFSFFLFICFTLSTIAGTRNTVLLVEHPQGLTILDAYKRSVPESVKEKWPAFLPVFLGEKETLQDGITHVQKTRIMGKTYFLILTPSGQPQGLETCGFYRKLKNVALLGDTVQIKIGKALPLLHPKTFRVLKTVPAGQKFIRLFKYRAYYYVRTFKEPFTFAYLATRYRNRLQKISRAQLKSEQQLQDLMQQVSYFLNRKNRVYRKLFEYFQQATGKMPNRKAPQWHLKKHDHTLRVVFSDPQFLRQWKRSTQIFSEQLKNLCRQFNFTLQEQEPGTFTILQVRP